MCRIISTKLICETNANFYCYLARKDMELQIAMNSPAIRHGEEESADIEQAMRNVKFPKLFMSHGQEDPIVSLRWAKNTFNELRVLHNMLNKFLIFSKHNLFGIT